MNNEKALKDIRNASALAAVSSLLTLVVIAISMGGDFKFIEVDLYSLIDAILVLALSFGIKKKSRICAIGLFVYFILGKIDMIASGANISRSIIGIIIFGTCYFQGVRGTIYYHKNIKNDKDLNELKTE
ncbi:UNVERIFIED_ORG: hypothetical protein B2H98_06645 [Clostridium botulinum]